MIAIPDTVTANTAVARRTQLIKATIDVIWADGLSRLTLAKVATRAGLSMSIVNFYFKTKEYLLLATLQSVAGEFEQVVERAFSASAHPAQILKSVVDVMLGRQFCTPARTHTGQHKYQEL